MGNSGLDEQIITKIKELEEKYASSGQDMLSYLEGLLHADYLKYWDYIHLDTLLTLQNPRTDFPDEEIFIIYHQITELYFKLILNELGYLVNLQEADVDQFQLRLGRVNRYFEHLANSFSIMTDGMEKEQFLKFRMALLPASGFQSAQYRFIEIHATDMKNLVASDHSNGLGDDPEVEAAYEHIYWKKGATELSSNKKTLTLRHFEQKYDMAFIELGQTLKEKNIAKVYKKYFAELNNEKIVIALRRFDELANVHWRLAHLKSAVRYLQKKPDDIAATGGTNWQKYLPPGYQHIIFFPELWSEEEKVSWGRSLFTKNR